MWKQPTYTKRAVARLPYLTLETDSFLSATSGWVRPFTITAIPTLTSQPTTLLPKHSSGNLTRLTLLWDKTSSLICHGSENADLNMRGTFMILWLQNIFYRKRSVGLLDLLLLQKSMTLPKRRKTLWSRISKAARLSTTYRGR